MEFANAGDYSFYNGHYYSNKSPGHALLAVPSFALAEYILKHLFPDNPELQVRLSAYVSTVCTTGVASSFLCLLIFYVCINFLRMNIARALFCTLFFGFGTLAFSYSTTFYTHQLSAFFLFAAFVLILQTRKGYMQNGSKAMLIAGLSFSLGVLGEPSVIFGFPMLSIYLLTSSRTRKYLPYFILGGVPAGFFQVLYNVMCFGHPLSYSYQFANEIVMVEQNAGLFGIPSVYVILNLLILPYRGLFVSSPILIMAIPGFFMGLRSKEFRAEVLVCSSTALAFFIFLASYYGWDGGSTVGPRDIVPMFPFLFLLVCFSFRRFPKLCTTIGFVSIIINLSITLVGHEIPSKIENPLRDVVLKNILQGNVSINPFPVSNLENYMSSYHSIFDFADIEKWEPNFNSFNIGEIIFPNNLASIVPLLCFWGIWLLAWRKYVVLIFYDTSSLVGRNP
jgi:hypothetical protein